ncbi:MAG TPA: beta-phosphoglucomutase [Sphingomicrobium sp.]|nr:beta-phosphoglucomutase [Sphingomicrobium sp.]
MSARERPAPKEAARSRLGADHDDGWVFARGGPPADDAQWLNEGSLFALADGVLGVRGGIEELQPSGGCVYLNRVYDVTPIQYHEKFIGFPSNSDTRLPVADGSIIELRLGDANVSDGQIVEFSRQLDLRTGELVRFTRWLSSSGATIDVIARRVVFAGGVLALRFEVKSIDYSGPVSLVSRLEPGSAGASQSDDPRHGVGEGDRLETSKVGVEEAEAWLLQRGRAAGVGAAVAQAQRSENLRFQHSGMDGEGAVSIFVGDLQAGGSASLEKVLVYVPFELAGEDEALAEARERAATQILVGYHTSAQAAARELAQFWSVAAITIPDDPELTLAMRFNLFHLRRSAPADGRTGLAAKGLTGEGYQGHAFWDSEAFALPVLALTAPELARSDLAFRISGLDRARAHAREMDHQTGALYPWRTIAGDEGSSYFPSGSAQYHINAAIAYGVRIYDRVTGDDAFVRAQAAPMVFETARIWLEAGFHDPRLGGAFRICSVTGPDEYSVLVDDDHYTNRMAQLHLEYALELAERAPQAPGAPDASEKLRWTAAAQAMHLPVDPALGVHPQDWAFLDKPEWTFTPGRRDRPLLLHYHPLTLSRHQVIKQASVVLAHVLTKESSRAQQRRDFDYYEPRTAHDSSLSASPHAIVAARIGQTSKAHEFLRESVFVDLHNLHGNVGHGLHMASMAGGWQALVWGFAGLKLDRGILEFVPRSAPELRAYSFGLTWRGSTLTVEVDPARTRYSLSSSSKPLTLLHDGLPISLGSGQTMEKPTPRFGIRRGGEFKALVFDLDGVLTDTARAHYIAWKALADHLGIPFDEEANEALKGIDRNGSLDLILSLGDRDYDEQERAVLADRKNGHYQQLIADFGPADVLKGAREGLERARSAGLPMALASVSRNAPALLDRLGIAHFFDVVIDPATVSRSKPDPAIFLAAARELGIEPSACLGIEDSRAGIAAIKAAGMTALGVGDPAVLDAADAVVADLSSVDWSLPVSSNRGRF